MDCRLFISALALALAETGATSLGPDRKNFVVKPQALGYDRETYAGFFNTSWLSANNAMYWWYFPSRDGNTSAPLVLWLQGGPGASSLNELFTAIGPLKIGEDLKVTRRSDALTWNDRMSMLFIDNPVGSGFSHARSERGWCRDSKYCVAANLVDCAHQFFDVFPELRAGGLWIAGESYAGHYIPPFAVAAAQQETIPKIHLNGILMGDPWWEPAVQIQGYADVVLNSGLADATQAKAFRRNTDRAVELIAKGLYKEAFHYHDITIAGMVTPYATLYKNVTGDVSVFNSRRATEPIFDDWARLRQALQQPWFKSAINAGGAEFSNGTECVTQLLDDNMHGYKEEVEELLQSGYPVLIYNGQDDFIVAPRLTEDVIASMQWAGRGVYEEASRGPWHASGDADAVSGWKKAGGGLTHAVVRGGGHFLRADQPLRVKSLVTNWILSAARRTFV